MQSSISLPAGELVATATADPAWRRAADHVRRLLFGHDVFISYARADALEYAQALADALTRQRVYAYIDQLGSPPGPELPRQLLLRLRLSSMMVLVASPEAASSRPVAREVAEFTRRSKRLFVVDVAGALDEAEWYRPIKGGPARRITAGELVAGVPSDPVVGAILKNCDFGRREDRLRRIMRYTLLGVALIVAAGVAGVKLARDQAGRWQEDALRSRAELLLVQDSVRAARASAASALEVAADARGQSIRADSVRRLAEAGARTADAAARAARDRVAVLVSEQEALSVVSRATAAMDGSEAGVAQSLLLAVESLRAGWTPQGAGAWLSAMARVSRPLDSRRAHAAPVRALAVSSDGARVASGSDDGTVVVWRVRDDPGAGVELVPQPLPEERSVPARGVIGALAFSPDGRMLAVQGDARIEVWRVDGAVPVKRLSRTFARHSVSIAFSPDGGTLAAVGDDRVELIDTRDGGVTRLRSGPGALQVLFSRSGTRLAVAGETRVEPGKDTTWIEFWDRPAGVRTARVDSVFADTLSPSGDTVGYTGVQAWGERWVERAFNRLIPAAGEWWLPDSEQGVRLTPEAVVITIRRGEQVVVLMDATVATPGPDQRWVAAGAADGTVSLLPASPNIATDFIPQDSALAIVLSPDGRWMALTAGSDTVATLRVVEIATGREVMRQPRFAGRFGFSRDGRWMLAGSGNAVRTYSTGDWRVARVLRTPEDEGNVEDGRLGAPFLSPDSRWLAMATNTCGRGEAYIWEVATGAQVAACARERRRSGGAAADSLITWPLLGEPQGWAAGLAESRGVRLQDPATGREVGAVAWPYHAETFSAGGEWLAMLADGGVLLWPIGRRETMIAEACARLSRNLNPDEWRREFPYQPYRHTCPGLPVPPSVDPEG